MTDNKHWIFLEKLRRSGAVNMYGSAPYLEEAFGMERQEAVRVVSEWMKNYNRDDYKDLD